MKKIAIVEDNPDNRELVRIILSAQYEVTDYASGLAALEGIRRDRPDLVLLDVSLPQMDGPEVVRRLRAEAATSNLPVIAFTAHAAAGNREEILRAGFNDYIAKPVFNEDDLLGTIERWLSQTSESRLR